MIELSHLSLKRCQIRHFKSLRSVDLNQLNNVVLLMGRNNAGKSNVLDAFKFLADAAISFDHALAARGKNLLQVIHRKKEGQTMEFIFDFALAPAKRLEMVRRIYTGAALPVVTHALNSDFLTTLKLKISLGLDGFVETLSTPGLAEGVPWDIFVTYGAPGSFQAQIAPLEGAVKLGKDDSAPALVPLEIKTESAAPYRLHLARPDAPAWPLSEQIAEAVHQQFVRLEWADPMRKLPASAPIQGATTLAPDISNLTEVLHWLHNNKPKTFRKIEAEVGKLVPNLGRLYTPTLQNEATLGMMDAGDEDLVYSMDQMSFGTRSLIAVMAKVILAPEGAWLCLEEPETYLHPAAQIELFRFLRDEGKTKRIFVATHSTAIAASCPLPSLFLVQRDATENTTVSPVTAQEAPAVIEQLGVKPSFSFEAGAIVFVEEADQVPLFAAWAKKYPFHVKLQFLETEGAATLHYFANTRIAKSAFVQTQIFAIFGNGSESSSRTRRKLMEQLGLPDSQAYILDFPEVEGYLLDGAALAKVVPALSISIEELAKRIDPALTLPDQKKALHDLLVENGLSGYSTQIGIKIAEAMVEIPPTLLQLFQRIDAASKPYWTI